MSTITAPIYAAMIAGSIPASGVDTDDAIMSIAATNLHDDRLHVLYANDGQRVYYYAVPSRKVSHATAFATPLAAAMPGHPAHCGDGIYVLPGADVAAVKHGAALRLVHGCAAIDEAAREQALPMYRLPADAETWQLQSLYSRQRKLITRVTARLAHGAAYVLAVSLVSYLSLSAWQKYTEVVRQRAVPTAQMVSHLQYTSPLFEQLAHFQQISATVVRAGGWIEGYVWKPGKGEAFEIVMPGWISHDYVEALGPGTTTDYNIPDNLVTARKGDLEKLSKP